MVRRQGFTLVELLVVIGIIAVLIGILLPALSGARYQASLVACESQLHQIAIASVAYATDNKGMLPPMRNDWGATYSPSNDDYTWLPNFSGTAVNDNQGALVGRLLQTHYLGASLPLPKTGTTTDFSQAKILYCPSSDPATRSTTSTTGTWPTGGMPEPSCITTRFGSRRSSTTGKPPSGAVPCWQPGFASGGVAMSGTTLHQFTVNMSLANDNLLPSAAGSTVTDGAMPHDYRNRRCFNLAYADGHVTSVRMDYRFNRAYGNATRDLDLLAACERVAAGQQFVVTSAWQNKDNYAPFVMN